MSDGPNREYLEKMADAEDAAGCVSVGGMAADLGMLPFYSRELGEEFYMKELKLIAYSPADKMPPQNTIVLIQGGIGKWNPTHGWLSMMPDSVERPLQWQPQWWAELCFDEEIGVSNG